MRGRVKILKFQKKFLPQMVRLYCDVYSSSSKKVTKEMGNWTLSYCLKISPDFCLMTTDADGQCLGAVFSRRDLSYVGRTYYVETIQVEKKFRNLGVAQALMTALVRECKEKKIDKLYLDFDNGNKKLKYLYSKLGFKDTGWVVYDMSL